MRAPIKTTTSAAKMAGVQVHIDFGPTFDTLQHFRARLKAPMPLARYYVLAMEAFFQAQFRTEGAAGGSPWKPLRPATLKLRQRPGHGRGGILYDTGRLFASYTKPGLMAIRKATQVNGVLTVTRGSKLKRAYYQQVGWLSKTVFGHKRRRPPVRRIPARRVIPRRLPPPLVTAWVRAAKNYYLYGHVPGGVSVGQ